MDSEKHSDEEEDAWSTDDEDQDGNEEDWRIEDEDDDDDDEDAMFSDESDNDTSLYSDHFSLELAFEGKVAKRRASRQTSRSKCSIYIEQRAGGIYTFPQTTASQTNKEEPTLKKTTALCITGCLSCVGIYLPIDDRRCFAAHIDGTLYKELDQRDMSVWQISEDLASSLQDLVRSSLHRTFKRLQRELDNVRQREDLKERAVIVCTWPVVGQQQGPGSLIIDVLLDYFQLDREKVVTPYKRHHGFIIDHFSSAPAPQHVQLLGWTCPGPSEQMLDQIAKIADNCTEPSWGLNFRSVFRATYTYVMYWDLGWESLPPLTKDRKKLWHFESDEGEEGWHIGESPAMHDPEQK